MLPFVQVMREADYNKLYDEKLNNSRQRRERRDSRAQRRGDPDRQRTTAEQRRKGKLRQRMFDRGMGIDLPFLLLVLVLLVIGMIMMFSASFPVAYYNLGDSYYYIKRQAIFAAIGLAAMILLSFFNYNKLHRVAVLFMGFSWVLLLIVLVIPGNVHRWFAIGNFNVQPSEIAKFSIILFFAHWCSLYNDKMQYAKYSVLPGLIVFGITAGLLILEPHFSGIVIIGILTVVMLYVGGMRVKYLAMGGVALGVIILILAVTGGLSYAMERMDGWGQALNYTSASDPVMWNTTWQTRNSLYAIGSGGLFGLGLGNSRQKFLYLPEPQNDFVFAIVCEEIGFIGALIILLIFALLVWRGITLSLRSKDRFGKLLGIGLSAQIGIQVVLNILVITDWLPNTGISLPFFSYGGSSLIMLLAQMGLVLSISRTANIEKQ